MPNHSYAKSLRITSGSAYTTLDPHIAYDWLSYITVNPICANLVKQSGPDNKYYPDIAEKIEYENNGSKIVFHLRNDIHFHSGIPLTANDVSFSINRVTSSKINSPGAVFFNMIKGYQEYRNGQSTTLSGVKVLNNYLLEIELIRPSNSFMYSLSTNFGCILPIGTKLNKFSIPISSGPYQVRAYTSDGDLILEKYKKSHIRDTLYFNFDEIYIQTKVSADEALHDFSLGKIDLILDGLPWVTASQLQERATENYSNNEIQNPSINTTYISLNTQKAPFDNQYVRRAVSFAINRDRLVHLLSDSVTTTDQIIPPGLSAHRTDRHIYSFDPAHARMLIKKSGLELPIKANIYAVDTKLYKTIIHSIISDLQKVGILVTPFFGTHEAVLKIASSASPGQMVFSDGLGWIADFPDESNFFFPLLSAEAITIGGWNWSHYNNPEIDRLAVAADELIGTDAQLERTERWRDIFYKIEMDAPVIPLYNRRSFAVSSPYTTASNSNGLEKVPASLFLGYFPVFHWESRD